MFPNKHERKPEQLVFHLKEQAELNAPEGQARHAASMVGFNPQYINFECGVCGKLASGRVLCDVTREDGQFVSWCLCSCEKKEPTILTQKDGKITAQLPVPRKFHSNPKWPDEIAFLYDDAAKSFAAGAFTSSSMACRKLLMSVACDQQAKAGVPVEEGKTFAYYVDYLADNVLTFAGSKQPIDAIRKIGNEANHHVAQVDEPDAERSMTIVQYMLDVIYTFPEA